MLIFDSISSSHKSSF